MKVKYLSVILVVFLISFGAVNAAAHCEIPCGIYDDQLRADLIAEHLTTIEKSIKKIVELSKQNPANYNQLIRCGCLGSLDKLCRGTNRTGHFQNLSG